jgi:hypothetical protein
MASRIVKSINRSYIARHAKKSSKGLGIYAYQLPGVGPNGVHVQAMKGGCKCGGCSGRRA